MIVIIDYGMGNLGSVLNMFRRVSTKEVIISSDPEKIKKADKLILPGVGSFKKAILNLNDREFKPLLKDKVLVNKTPILGICLGMQLFFESSEEGDIKGLGWLKGKVVRFQNFERNNKLKIPHMGWNFVKIKKKSKLTYNLNEQNKFYFVHSYHVAYNDKTDILMNSNYGYKFVSAVENENIFGFQFHPEKSHNYGKVIFKNFSDL